MSKFPPLINGKPREQSFSRIWEYWVWSILYAVFFYPPCAKFIYGPRPVLNGSSKANYCVDKAHDFLYVASMCLRPLVFFYFSPFYFSLSFNIFYDYMVLYVCLGQGLEDEAHDLDFFFFICLINKYHPKKASKW